MASFDHFSPEALRFLNDLAANNTRAWFADNKGTYETEIKAPARDFADAIRAGLTDLTGQPHMAKIFRIHRDVRFSKDKTPYNAHLHLSFTPQVDVANPPMWFFGLSPDKLSIGCGVFQYDKATLPAFRNAMAGAKGAELIQLAQELERAGVRVGPPELKRVPSGFDKDHRNADALRRKGFSGWLDVGDVTRATRPGLAAHILHDMGRLTPIYDALMRID